MGKLYINDQTEFGYGNSEGEDIYTNKPDQSENSESMYISWSNKQM